MKLALVTETFPPEINGVAMTFGIIARELGRRGHAVTVYRPRRDDHPAGEAHPELVEVPLPRSPLLRHGLAVPCDQPTALIEAAILLATDEFLRAQLRPAAMEPALA